MTEGLKATTCLPAGRKAPLPTNDLGYGNDLKLVSQIAEVSKLLAAYFSSILDSDS